MDDDETPEAVVIGEIDLAAKRKDVETIALLMQHNPQNDNVQLVDCKAFAALSFDANGVDVDAVAGGVRAVIVAMTRNAIHAPLQSSGCDALKALVRSTNQWPRGIGMEAIGAVLSAMKMHPSDESVICSACEALGAFCCTTESMKGKKKRAQKAVADAGCIGAVLDAMKQHPSLTRVLQMGCFAVRYIVADHSTNAAAVGRCGGLATLALAMESHPDAEGIQFWGCAALRHLAAVGANRRILRELHVERTIAAAMDTHTHVRDLRDAQFVLEKLRSSDCANSLT